MQKVISQKKRLLQNPMVLKQKAKMPGEDPIPSSQLIDIRYYTDPLCCWSWAFEPQWRRLLYEFDGQINYSYCMGGLLPGWKNYNDSVNSVSRPIQMGPVWMHAQQLSGMLIQHTIWMRNPPSSSYSACIAVKSATLQSARAGEMYLRLLRESVMIRGENIAEKQILNNAAEKLVSILPAFDIKKFKEAIKNESALEAFRKDLAEVQYHNINRFPSLVIKNHLNNAIIISGYRPYSVLLDAVMQVGNLTATQKQVNASDFKQFWPSFTDRELDEIK